MSPTPSYYSDQSFDERSMITTWRVIDPTTEDVEFDHTCLDLLDDQLLLHPFEAFTQLCWETCEIDAGETHSGASIRDTWPQARYMPRQSFEDSSDDSYSDDDPTTPVFETQPLEDDDSYFANKKFYYNADMDEYYYDNDDDDNSSLISIGPQMGIPDPAPVITIGQFPVTKSRTRSKRFQAQFRALCLNISRPKVSFL